MTRPESAMSATSFDLATLAREMRGEDAYLRDGHTARTLLREPDLRSVLIVMNAGARIAEHRADDTACILTFSGHVRLGLPGRVADLPAGQLLVLQRGLRHDVEAVAESALLLTLGWKQK